MVLTVCKRIVLDHGTSSPDVASMLHAPPPDMIGGRPVNILHRLSFARGSEALDFVRTLRELTDARFRGELDEIAPVLVYGALIVVPDSPAELYVSIGALALAHALGIKGAAAPASPRLTLTQELPADMALLFTASTPDERIVRGL